MRNAAIVLMVAALAAAAGLVACELPVPGATDDPPGLVGPGAEADPLAAFMGTRQERAARAPYSPEGWPLRRGDITTWDGRNELLRRFSVWDSYVQAPFWMGKTVFGAYFTSVIGAPGQTIDHSKAVYHGHFPEKTLSWPPRDALPEHLRGRDLGELKSSLYTLLGGPLVPSAEMVETWTEDAWLDGFTGKGLDRP